MAATGPMVEQKVLTDEELGALAQAAKDAADRAVAAIDDALSFIAASNERMTSMEAAATPGD